MTNEQLLTVEELAAFLQVSPGTVYQWRHRGYGPKAVKVGGAVRWRRDDVVAWIEAQTEASA